MLLAWPHYAIAQEFDRVAWHDELNRLAQICSSLELNAEAAITRSWLPTERQDLNVLFLPDQSPGHGGTGHRAQWAQQFQMGRVRYAQWLFQQAHGLATAGDEAAAFRMLWQVLREDAEHAEAKRILGTLAKAATVTPRLRRGTTIHPDFGWPAGSYSRIETPHFELTTRGDPQSSVKLAQLMERFYAMWRQVFYPLWSTPGALTKKFEGRNVAWERATEMSVVLLADREDYLKLLGIAEQNAAVSVGYYAPHKQMSFFYAAPNYEVTLFHELTHQLIAEATNFDASPEAGSTGGVWLTEGIALYMESLMDRGSYWTVGGIDASRLQTARYRALRDGYWADWQTFTTGPGTAWKEDPQIGLLYTQATGLMHLFMDRLSQPAARDALMQALISVYQTQPEFDPLLGLLTSDGVVPQTAYQRELLLGDADVHALCTGRLPCESLVLARSQLTRDSWRKLEALANHLQWLDLSHSNATAADLEWLGTARQLQRLSVEGTRCDGNLVRHVAALPQLQELDVSGCPIDDAALEPLRGHPHLETLWLTRTQVTDAVLETLDTLPALRFCHIDGSGITAAAWEAFERSHPQLTK